MIRRIVASCACLLIAAPLLSASLVLSPVSQATDSYGVVYVSAVELSEAAGIDIVIRWDPDLLSCFEAVLDPSRIPDFTEVLRTIDQDSGRLELVLLRLGSGGFSGGADSLLAMKFEGRSKGSANVNLVGWESGADPVLVTAAAAAVAVASSAVTIEIEGVPSAHGVVKLYQNFPNPFNPVTTIRFYLFEPATVTLRIYDAAGRLVRSLIGNERYGEGIWEMDWDGCNAEGALVPSGIYFYVLDASGKTESRKLVVLR